MAGSVTVTGNLQDIIGAALQGNAFVRAKLRNFTGFVPRVNGTTVLQEVIRDIFPDVNGNISTTLWGNDTITPPNTFYSIEFWDNGRIVASGNYILTGVGPFDLTAQGQLNPPPGPPSPFVIEVNGIMAQSQAIVNLKQGPNMTIVDQGGGDILFSSGGSGGGGGSGTVTSVGLTVPTEFVAGGTNPVVAAGVIAVTKATQPPNTVWSGPASGGAAQPAFRALVTADLPTGLGTVTDVSGPLAANAVVIGNGGNDLKTLAALGAVGQILTSNGAGSPPSFQNAPIGGGGGGGASLGSQTVTFSSTPIFAPLSQITILKMTLSGNVTSSTFNPASISAPAFVLMQIVQNGTGGFAFNYPANFKNAGSVGADPNQTTFQLFYWDGTNCYGVTSPTEFV